MKAKIVIRTKVEGETGEHQSEVWNGELEIQNEKEYLVKMSVLIEGEPHPIVDIPFAMGVGHYVWIPGDPELEDESDGWNLN